MNDENIPEQSHALKAAIKSPDASRLLASNGLEQTEFENFLDARTALSDPGIASYPPDIALKPTFPITVGDEEPEKARTIDDVNLEADLTAVLQPLSVAGYILRVSRRGQPVFTLNSGWGRLTGNSDPTAWTPALKMHVASVSKLVTAMAITKLLHDKGLHVDEPVAGFLPAYFSIASSAAPITFRHLLTHTSGFHRIDQGGLNDGYTFGNFRYYMQQGVNPADVGRWHYHNANYIGLRIALSIMTGRIDRNASFVVPGISDSNDAFWDALSAAEYARYVARHVFRPASVTATLTPGNKDSLAYAGTLTTPGWAADASAGAGTVGWWLSADEILSVMDRYWQGDAIVPRRVARQSLRYGFGPDQVEPWQHSGDIQDCFIKGGFWADGGGRTQNCVVAFAPDDTVIAGFVNSPISGNTMHGIVATALQANIA